MHNNIIRFSNLLLFGFIKVKNIMTYTQEEKKVVKYIFISNVIVNVHL